MISNTAGLGFRGTLFMSSCDRLDRAYDEVGHTPSGKGIYYNISKPKEIESALSKVNGTGMRYAYFSTTLSKESRERIANAIEAGEGVYDPNYPNY